MSAILVSLAIITGFVSVDTCSAFAIDALVCLDNTLGQGFSSSGRQTCMELPCMFPIVWADIVTPTLSGSSDQP